MLFKIETDKSNINQLSELEIEIYFDKEGLEYFIEQLNKLLIKDKTSHLHFMTPSWGGNELSELIIRNNNITVNHLKIIINPEY